MIMQWTNVPWASGVIKAIGTKGTQTVTDSIKTVGPEAKVMLKPDHTTLYADGDDAASIEVSVGDANNNFVYSAVDQVSFTLSGAGRSLGIASGDWSSNEPFKGTARKLYHGKVLIVIQSTMTPGTINLTVSAAGLTPATLTLTTVAPTVGVIRPNVSRFNTIKNMESVLTCSRNPVSNAFRIGYRVDEPGMVALSVISPSGRVIHSLANNFHKVGNYSTQWKAMNETGVYFVVLKTSNNTSVRKAVLVQ
jgi:hypothetical protein